MRPVTVTGGSRTDPHLAALLKMTHNERTATGTSINAVAAIVPYGIVYMLFHSRCEITCG
jgi:hypothetical protein